MLYKISHTTTHAYGELVSPCQNVAHLAPRACPWQQTEPHVLSISPDPAVIEERIDFFGNPVEHFTVQEPHRELKVSVKHTIAVEPLLWPKASSTPPSISPAEFITEFAYDPNATTLQIADIVYI
ncbi:MAG TPA: transglutaminase N-terminal domain-containing protein [Urbifossiella sp.]|jgi:transglutaminase-like putative cysteine protease